VRPNPHLRAADHHRPEHVWVLMSGMKVAVKDTGRNSSTNTNVVDVIRQEKEGGRKAKPEKIEDKALRDRVEQQLDWDPEITSTMIGVGAADGVVTLSGNVESYTEKIAAEKAALRTYGVKGVANEIAIRPIFKTTDTQIASTAVAALAARANIPKDKVTVTVKNGRIYLDGTVPWKFQKDAAELAVSHLYGATGVENRIMVKSSVSTADVKHKIEAAFTRSAEVDARRITVTALDGKVGLWGNVSTWAEKREAERAAWQAPGVHHVDDHLHIVP
jgi:osmotically-inducible protein OsmY